LVLWLHAHSLGQTDLRYPVGKDRYLDTGSFHEEGIHHLAKKIDSSGTFED